MFNQRPFLRPQSQNEEAKEDSKAMRFDFRNNKRNHVFVKFAVCFLLLGLAFRLFSSSSSQFSSDDADASVVVGETLSPPANASPVSGDLPVNENSTVNEIQTSQNATEECDIFTGEWVRDPSGPFYTNESCHHIEAHQNCMKNGRPDSEYLYWRWKPRDCELPRFDPQRFLEFMRNKSWAFIGDSISRNHVQSLLCTLSQVEQAIEVYHDKEYRSRRWHFTFHNFTLSVIWTPFLVKAAIFEDINGVSRADIQLHLDKLDPLWTKQYKNFDYVLIAGGKWFLKTAIYYENDTIKGCHYCPGKNLTELGFDHAYRKALRLIFNFVTTSNHKAYVFFRTTTPDHFENGEWFSGGYCNRTAPFKEGEAELSGVDTTMRNVEFEEFEKAVEIGLGKGVTLKLLDTTHLSLLRPDGHPGVYRQFQPLAEVKNGKAQNDCLHWCLPGPIDSWNELIMNMLSTG
ncbi:protein trichome birefringence-like [Sarracenia purpurea var. burkii]